MIEGIIYKYTSPSGKCYIGQTTNEKIRREHWNTIGSYAGVKIDRARVKYGISNFTYEVIVRNRYRTKKEAKEELDKLEIYYINEYNSVREASEKTKIKMCTIYKCLSGDNKTAGGFIWKYKED